MAIWFELGIFVVVLVFGLWQINDVKKARRATQSRREAEARLAAQREAAASNDTPPIPPA
ncbi:hypothetical protein [Hydrogenophaga sp. IBVHS2]|uniref:hypothetical protein n=1 Tax=Hydrogenophaga sp. IBVHS2 TaxID=1985170 RepID=UPI000A2D36BE|nr:hypothetical protein [Hydrogenophaga sp. IBVHS2]OSZ65935.1 hypothetical protein CAP38_07845 [Hydrogenophaga sp. IBVHS2]